ncbi:hypothetical protein EB796_025105 [Bugula neritina]|uniref:Uncharacterized protein n=1 Tax=Bugula neritina TaxID=10212 RepID=A0A7J7ISP0_BUGNE|nr:hypothetical protein EB796_025105 [Bugula neritina]
MKIRSQLFKQCLFASSEAPKSIYTSSSTSTSSIRTVTNSHRYYNNIMMQVSSSMMQEISDSYVYLSTHNSIFF